MPIISARDNENNNERERKTKKKTERRKRVPQAIVKVWELNVLLHV